MKTRTNIKQFILNELSKQLYQRAADKAKKLRGKAGDKSSAHFQRGFKRGESLSTADTQKEQEKSGPNLGLGHKFYDLQKERNLQVGKFSAAAKGVRSRRPSRGYSLGALQKSLNRQSDDQEWKEIEANEGKQKQADIKSDIELTQAGASSSSDPKSKRYSPSLHTMHNDPESIKRRKGRVKKSRINRGREKAWAWAQGRGPFPFKGIHEGSRGLKRLGRVLKAQRRDQRSVPEAGKEGAGKDFNKIMTTLRGIRRKHAEGGIRQAQPNLGRKNLQGIEGAKDELAAPHGSTRKSAARAYSRSVGSDPKPEDAPRKVQSAEIGRVLEPSVDRKISTDVAKYKLRRKMRKEGGRN